MPPQLREEANPANPEEWWNRAKELQLDPRKLDITTYESRSASKFTELDFIHLRAVWSNNGVDRFHINEYVRPEHIKTWDFVLAKQPQTPARSAALPKDWLVEFIHTTSSPFTNDDAKNMRLGAFMTVKSHIEKIRRTNGIQAGGHALKIRRSARIMSQNGDLSALSQQMGSLLINQRTGGATTPPNARRTPSPQASSGSPANIKTHELDVISPETMALEKDRSRDEDTVNMALVSLLDATTICSGIRKLGARQNLSWFLTRQSFQLGLPHKPVCEARTDGVLVLEGNPSRTLAILEVKPYKRTKNQITVEWQEACQMAAWISTSLSPGTPSRKRKEGILTFGDDTKRRYVTSALCTRRLYTSLLILPQTSPHLPRLSLLVHHHRRMGTRLRAISVWKQTPADAAFAGCLP